MSEISEVAPDIFRITTYVPEADLQFSQFLVRDNEPLLFHTGMRGLFPLVHEAVATLIDPATLRWIGFSHFEADECGSLNEWLAVAPKAQAVCSLVGAMVSVNDFATREARPMQHDEVLVTGKRRFRFRQTPHVPHCWEAGLMFEESTRTLFASDLFHQGGNLEALTTNDVVDRARATLVAYQASPLANYLPYTAQTGTILQGLAALKPGVIATMHGSVYEGDGERAMLDFATMMKEVLGPPA
jgi:flavorubredoxin